jgi:hypothetical protein
MCGVQNAGDVRNLRADKKAKKHRLDCAGAGGFDCGGKVYARQAGDKEFGLIEAILCVMWLGAIAVLIYGCGRWRTFRECLQACLMPVAALYKSFGLFVMAAMIWQLIQGNILTMLVIPLPFLMYYPTAIFFVVVTIALIALSCAGGSAMCALLQLMRLMEAGRGRG